MGLMLAALVAGWIPATPLSAQIPGVIEPFDDVAELYLRANRLYEHGRDTKDYDEGRRALQTSIPIFREFINTAPNHEYAERSWYRLGMALLLTGDLQQAEYCFKIVIQQYKSGHYVASSAYRMASQRYNREEWADAAPYFGITAREASKNDLKHKALYYQARCLILADQGAAAIRVLNSIIDDPLNPFVDYARLAIGQLHAAAGRHEIALEQFQLLLGPKVAPQERAQAMLSAGESAAKLGKTELANQYLEQVLITPGLSARFKARAQLALMETRFAEEDYKAVVAMLRRGDFAGDPDIQARVYMLGAKGLSELEQYHEAIRYYFNVERLAPLTALGFEASYRRLVAFYKVNGPNLATQCDTFVRSYGSVFPDHPWLHRSRLMQAESLFHRGAPVEAGTVYSQIDPSKISKDLRPALLFKRGWCLADSGDYNGAAQSLSRFISQYPEHPQILEALAKRGTAYLKLSDRGSAIKDFNRLLASDPPKDLAAYAQQISARIHRGNKDYPKMIEHYRIVLKDFGMLPQKIEADANYWIGWGHFKLREWEKCIAPLERARGLAPSLYREPASTRLVLAAYSLKDAERLKAEVIRFRQDLPEKPLPRNLLTWLGLQLFQKGDFANADNFLTLAATPDDPEATDLIVWRHLAKARVEIRHFKRALEAITIILEREESPFWLADARLDQSHILVGLDDWDGAREAAHGGLALDPKGAVRAGLLMTLGDIAVERKDFESAAASFLRAADLFADDREIRPFALDRAIRALDANKQPGEAAKVRATLQSEFPGWSPDTNPAAGPASTDPVPSGSGD